MQGTIFKNLFRAPRKYIELSNSLTRNYAVHKTETALLFNEVLYLLGLSFVPFLLATVLSVF